jgi:hypothetical protein
VRRLALTPWDAPSAEHSAAHALELAFPVER